MALVMTSLNEEARIGGISLDVDVLERLAAYIEDMGVQFEQKVAIVHRKTVYQILIRILRLCPVDTGRLRGSWCSFMRANGFTGFEKFLTQPALGGAERKTPKTEPEPTHFSEGEALGSFVDAFLNTSISSNVVYASIVNDRQGYLTQALVWGDNRYKRNMELFLLTTAQKEAATDPIANDDDGQGGS